MPDPFDALYGAFGAAQQWLFEAVVQPVVFAVGLGARVEEAFDGTGWLLIGLLQLAVMVTAIAALERWRPVEAVVDRRAVRTDVVFTLIHRLGLVALGLYFVVQPVADAIAHHARMAHLPTLALDDLWPGVTDRPVVSFVLYLLLFDFVDYLYHRAQHAIGPWWALHAVHHSQRQMTMWSDNRVHLVDDGLRALVMAVVALAVGIGPGQFLAVLAAMQLYESYTHANVRVRYGPVLGRILVSPSFHRRHHAMWPDGPARNAEPAVRGAPPRSANFGVLFSFWDVLLGTADLRAGTGPTGIDDQVATPGRPAREYGRGFWALQWRALGRAIGRA